MRAIPTMSLSDLIQRASTELNEAHKRADASKQKPVMKFSECELEVTVTFEAEGSTGIKLVLFDLGGKAKSSNSSKIKLKFSALPDQPLQFLARTPDSAGPPNPRQQRRTKVQRSQAKP